MAVYPNTFENVTEANFRLKGTVVLYDGEPYLVGGIANHDDNSGYIPGLKIYLQPFLNVVNGHQSLSKNLPSDFYKHTPTVNMLDSYCDPVEGTFKYGGPLVRKLMTSPKFRSFKPFPLGFINTDDGVEYTERSPLRKNEQGLRHDMVLTHRLSPLIGINSVIPFKPISNRFWSTDFYNMLAGNYPSRHDAYGLVSSFKKTSMAFSRDWAFSSVIMNDDTYLLWKWYFVGRMKDPDTVEFTRSFFFLKESWEEFINN